MFDIYLTLLNRYAGSTENRISDKHMIVYGYDIPYLNIGISNLFDLNDFLISCI